MKTPLALLAWNDCGLLNGVPGAKRLAAQHPFSLHLTVPSGVELGTGYLFASKGHIMSTAGGLTLSAAPGPAGTKDESRPAIHRVLRHLAAAAGVCV